MPIVFKLVGVSAEGKSYEIRDTYSGNITLKMLYTLFNNHNFSIEELNVIKFVTEGTQMQEMDKEYLIKDEDTRIIFVFSQDETIRKKLLSVFIKVGFEVHNFTKPVQSEPLVKNEELLKPLTDIPPEIPTFTDEVINMMNQRTIKLFSDPDFKTLLRIYKSKPELFDTLLQYVQHGTVVNEALVSQKTLSDISSEELEKYKTLALTFAGFGLECTEEEILSKLIKYNGHLNLTLRSILSDCV
jgi:hypothetical protein